jgi:hypothetical protein
MGDGRVLYSKQEVMHMNRKIILIPLLSLFLVGCDAGPFANDEYKPKGMTPTHKIVRALTAEEVAIFDDSTAIADDYLKSFTRSTEMRIYHKKALPSHTTSATYDERASSLQSHKIYENGVFKTELSVENERIYEGSILNAEMNLAYYGVVNDDETEITTTLDLTDQSGEHTIENSTDPFDPITDYDFYFAIDLSTPVWSLIGLCTIGMTDAGLIAATFATNDVTPIGSVYVASDGSRFIVETNTFFEAYFAKGVDDETETEYYYLTQARSYEEKLIISNEVPNIADEPIEYLARPILLSFEEDIITASTATNNNFAIDSIPVPVEEEE